MSDRILIRVALVGLWFVTLSGWFAFFVLFKPGGACAGLPMESNVLWALVLLGLSVIVNWSGQPDERRFRDRTRVG